MVYTILIRLISVLLAGVLLLIVISVWPEPSEATLLKRNDEQRVEDLGLIIEAIHDFRNSNERLPYSLQELAESRPRLKWQDPVHQRPYDYTLINTAIYSLCAVFETDSSGDAFGSLPGFSRHGIGNTCVYRTFE
ncbi:MAG: hypothetical protein Q7W55_10900 [Pseudohongiella sp.]|nr:hypothetical protein [Pseudohongiella sp.]MDO9519676.1 hypothetical protein [Pseudohongiella sp.]MDP2128242.1 hypothetical protein [Pseudohongiella sp.]